MLCIKIHYKLKTTKYVYDGWIEIIAPIKLICEPHRFLNLCNIFLFDLVVCGI